MIQFLKQFDVILGKYLNFKFYQWYKNIKNRSSEFFS